MDFSPRWRYIQDRLPHDTILFVPGAHLVPRNGDVMYPFRQDSDFLYLTGLSVPDLSLSLSRDEVILWREPISDHDRLWGSEKKEDTELTRISGISDIRDRQSAPFPEGMKLGIYTEDYLHLKEDALLGSSLIHTQRTIKSPEEIDSLRARIRDTDDLYHTLRDKIIPGIREYEIEAYIAYEFRRRGGTEAFPTIVASGPHTCTLHHVPTDRMVVSGDAILIDMGMEKDGYGADISRSFRVSGGESMRYDELYDAVLDVRKFAEDTLRPGITRRAWNMDVKEYMYSICQKLHLPDIEKSTPLDNPYFPHSIGHFLGLDTHDVGDSDTPFLPGMVLTIEPGLYLREESIGIRIEDDYLVTDTGCVCLSEKGGIF